MAMFLSTTLDVLFQVTVIVVLVVTQLVGSGLVKCYGLSKRFSFVFLRILVFHANLICKSQSFKVLFGRNLNREQLYFFIRNLLNQVKWLDK